MIVVLFPYLIWLDLSGGTGLLGSRDHRRQSARLGLARRPRCSSATSAWAILIVLGRGYVIASRGAPPEVSRAPVDPAARSFVYFFALAPVVAMGLFALFTRRPDNFVGAPLVVMSGLAVIVAAGDRIRLEHQYLIGYAWAALLVLPPLLVALAIVIQPWIFAIDLRVGRPAAEMGRFFGDSFQRRTGRPLAIVAGDPSTAALVSLDAPSRPSLYLESAPEYLPRVTLQDVAEKGAVVIWPAFDTAGQPPPDIQAAISRSGARGGAARFQAAVPGPDAVDPHGLGRDPRAPGSAPEPQVQTEPPLPLPLPPQQLEPPDVSRPSRSSLSRHRLPSSNNSLCLSYRRLPQQPQPQPPRQQQQSAAAASAVAPASVIALARPDLAAEQPIDQRGVTECERRKTSVPRQRGRYSGRGGNMGLSGD